MTDRTRPNTDKGIIRTFGEFFLPVLYSKKQDKPSSCVRPFSATPADKSPGTNAFFSSNNNNDHVLNAGSGRYPSSSQQSCNLTTIPLKTFVSQNRRKLAIQGCADEIDKDQPNSRQKRLLTCMGQHENLPGHSHHHHLPQPHRRSPKQGIKNSRKAEESQLQSDKMATGDDAKFGISIPEDIEKGDFMALTSLLQQKANDVRTQRVNWQSYLQCQMISQEDYNFIVGFDGATGSARNQFLQEQQHQCAKTFLNLMGHVSKDQTIYYILVLIDDMLSEDKNRVEIFKEYSRKKKESVWAPFLNMLNRQDGFITNMTSRILAKMACWSRELMDGSDLHFYLTWLKDQLRIPENEYIQSVARCLQMMLRIDEYRYAFVAVDGISTLVSVLSGRHNFQIQYQLVFCLWVLTFNPNLAEKMNKFNAIPILADILSDSVKEKVTRIVVAVFRNLIEKPEENQICKEHCIAMVQSKVLKHLDILQQRKFEDEDIQADIVFLSEKLQESIVDLSSFDEYASEVKSGRLEWSPVHRSEKFWRENAARLTEKNYELLKILIHILESSKDPIVLSVACYDIGEFVRHYPRGKTIIEQLGGKQVVMTLLSHQDSNVRYEALLSVQKLMVHNWEYLGKKLEQETKVPAKASA